MLSEATADTPEFSLNGRTLSAKIVACYDGDTFYAVLPLGEQLWKFNCRMVGYDTPEMKPPANKVGREIEKAKALKARQALLSHVCDGITETGTYTKHELNEAIASNKRVIEIRCKEFDKYGRLLVEIPLLASGTTVNEWMVEKGYGYNYSGGTKDNTFGVKLI
jgi:endonuclease YncB( thermonuclease family)